MQNTSNDYTKLNQKAIDPVLTAYLQTSEQLNAFGRGIERPKTGPGALCWCGCGEVIETGRKKTTKFKYPVKCHNRYWSPKLIPYYKKVIRESPQTKTRLEKNRLKAEAWIKEHPQVIEKIVDLATREMKQGQMHGSFRRFWEDVKPIFPNITFDNTFVGFVNARIRAKYPELTNFFRAREKK